MRNETKRRRPIMRFRTAALLLFGLLLAAAPRAAWSDDQPAAPAAKADKDAIQGIWKLVSAVHDGKTIDKPEGADALKIRFEGDRSYQVKGEEKVDPAEFKLDSDKSPKQIDLIPSEGPDKGKTMKGIYELAGDKLKLCIAGADRPADFKAGEKDQAVLNFERDK